MYYRTHDWQQPVKISISGWSSQTVLTIFQHCTFLLPQSTVLALYISIVCQSCFQFKLDTCQCISTIYISIASQTCFQSKLDTCECISTMYISIASQTCFLSSYTCPTIFQQYTFSIADQSCFQSSCNNYNKYNRRQWLRMGQ